MIYAAASWPLCSASPTRRPPSTNQPVVTSMRAILKSQRFRYPRSRQPRVRQPTEPARGQAALALALAVEEEGALGAQCSAFVRAHVRTASVAAPRSTSEALWAAAMFIRHQLEKAMPQCGPISRVCRRSTGARSWNALSARAICTPCRKASPTSPITSTAPASASTCISCTSHSSTSINSTRQPPSASTAIYIWISPVQRKKLAQRSSASSPRRSPSSASISSTTPTAPRASCSPAIQTAAFLPLSWLRVAVSQTFSTPRMWYSPTARWHGRPSAPTTLCTSSLKSVWVPRPFMRHRATPTRLACAWVACASPATVRRPRCRAQSTRWPSIANRTELSALFTQPVGSNQVF